MRALFFATALALASSSYASDLKIAPGFVTKLKCRGKLRASASGNDELLEVRPFTDGGQCALFVKPKALAGKTNLFVETSTASHSVQIEVRSGVTVNEYDLWRLK